MAYPGKDVSNLCSIPQNGSNNRGYSFFPLRNQGILRIVPCPHLFRGVRDALLFLRNIRDSNDSPLT
jgi:hypothetical protein